MSDSSQMSAQAHRTVWLQPLSVSKGYVKGDWSSRRGSEDHCRSTACQYSRALVPADKAHLHLFALQFWDLDCKICSFSALQTNLDEYKESFEMGISITWCSALPVWWWEQHRQHSEGENWIQRPLGQALLEGWQLFLHRAQCRCSPADRVSVKGFLYTSGNCIFEGPTSLHSVISCLLTLYDAACSGLGHYFVKCYEVKSLRYCSEL